MLDIITPPAGSGLTLAELKAHLREEQDDTANDDGIAALGLVAVGLIEASVQRAYAVRTLEWTLPAWRSSLRLPIAPVQAVEAVRYVDLAGTEQTLDPSAYLVAVSGRSRAVVPRRGTAWPLLGQGERPVVVRFRAGGVALPATVRHAAKLLVSHLYDNREAVANASLVEMPFGVEALISAERWS